MNDSAPKTTYLKDYKVPDFLINTIDLTFDLQEEAVEVTGKMQIEKNPQSLSNTQELRLNGKELELITVMLDGKPLSEKEYELTEQGLTVFNVPAAFFLEIKTRIYPQKNTALSGLYQSSGNFCTQCEAEGFRRIMYYLDRPDVMARFTTTIIADPIRYPQLLSNGNLIASGKRNDGRHWVTWEDPFKKPSYLFALVAGDLALVEDTFSTRSGKKVALKIYVEKNNQNKCAHAMQAVKKAMQWDETTYGREYDLDNYMIVAVSDFNMGAMENKGLNIFNTKYVLAKPETETDYDFIHVESVIAHEYFHNWTGNRITCRDWFQLSLKEGLTIFRDQGFTEDTTSKTVARIHTVNALRTVQFPEDASPLAHPVRPDSYIEINNFYTPTVYEKGSEVIRMMRTIIGNELFHKGMDLYFERFDGMAVTIEDFVKAMEDASSISLSQFKLWYSQAGTPEIEVDERYDKSQKKYTLTFKQSVPSTPGQSAKKPMHIPISLGLLDRQGNEITNTLFHLKEAQQSIDFEGILEKPIPSLLRSFSAPVKLYFPYADEDLIHLIKHDTDLFNRWEAHQTLATKWMLNWIEGYHRSRQLPEKALMRQWIEVLAHAIQHNQEEPWFLSELLMLPSEIYLAEQMAMVHVDAIHEVREYVFTQLGLGLEPLLRSLYDACATPSEGSFSTNQVAKRALKYIVLTYLTQCGRGEDLALSQFNASLRCNMTDTEASLRCLSNIDSSVRENALNRFYEMWKEDALVVDKWFSIQALSKLPNTLQNVKRLMHHEAFDIKNPNKVYALVGAFSMRNLVRFHAISGEGYEWLRECILRLDAINPQIAARMVKPFTSWRRYDEVRQVLMKKELLTMLNQRLSNDVYELVSKSLNESKEDK